MRPDDAARNTRVIFSVGVVYWPGRTAFSMWTLFDAGEIREDFARIAELGLDTVRFFLRWDAFQPAPDRVDAAMLDRLEEIVSLANDTGLACVPTLFTGHMAGVNFVPEWALSRSRPRGRYRSISNGAESPFACGDLYRGTLLEAQVVLARAVGERLRGRANVRAIDIGHDVGSLREPSHAKVTSGEHSTEPVDERVVAAWSKRLSDVVRDTSALPVTMGTVAADLTDDRNLRLGTLCVPFGFASMQGSTVDLAFARNRLDPEAIPFLAMIAATWSYHDVTVTGFGNPTCPPDRFTAFERFARDDESPNPSVAADDGVFATFPCLSDDENAAYCTAVLERLHADGRLGAYWWCWSDFERSHTEPPFDLAPHERTFGIVRSDGSEKPVAAALSAFARERRRVVASDDMPMIAGTYYYRTLPASTSTLYEAFLRHVSGRRGGEARSGT
jgi:hypothetical protein